MDATAAAPLLRLAGMVHDPRRHNLMHPLPEMIVMALIAILCGSDSWEDVGEFCEARLEWFESFLTLPHGIPSHDTFGRVFARLNPLQLDEMLRQWMATLGIASGGKLLAIDGKCIRGSFKHAWDKSTMAHLVSAFASEDRVALAQLCINGKENEITAIPRLLAMLDLRGSTVTIDAIGCQREIARQIRDAGGHYVLQVKENQPALHKKIEVLMKEAILEKLEGWRGDHDKDTEGGHGRIEERSVWLTTEVKNLGQELRGLWPSVRAIVAVQRERTVIGGSQSVERHYFILSNAGCTAREAAQIIRGHWGIENGLHHVLDVSFNEDRSRVRKGHGAENLSRMRRLTANLLRQNPSKRSIRGQRKRCGWSDQYLFDTLLRGPAPASPMG